MGSNMEQHWQEQEATYGGSEYDINWKEVKAGRSAGMPGKWVRGREGGREGRGINWEEVKAGRSAGMPGKWVRGREGGRGGASIGRK